ncbi:MAG: hypothetical protein AABY83_00170 [Pseudomonadota bacterium]
MSDISPRHRYRIRHLLHCGWFIIAGIAPCHTATASAWNDKGHVKYFYNHSWFNANDYAARSVGNSPAAHQINARYDGAARWDNWSMEAHYALLVRHTAQATFDTHPASVDSTQMFTLANWLIHDDRTQALQRVDRLNFAYTADQISMRVGRQAISWGNGINFHPMDIFNPFVPNAIDKDYKNGDDLAYAQWLFADGADAQAILAPRRTKTSGDLAMDQASIALKYRRGTMLGDVDVLIAKHYADDLIGMGWTKSSAGAVLRADAIATRSSDAQHSVAAVINADYSWTWFEYNIYGYAEYYYQSLGMQYPYAVPAGALADRLARNEIFVRGKHYFDAGVMIELAALVHLSPALVYNLADGSFSMPVNISYEMKQNWLLLLGATWNRGQRNTEFGGIKMTGTPYYAAPGQQAYLLIARYF